MADYIQKTAQAPLPHIRNLDFIQESNKKRMFDPPRLALF